VGSGGFVGGATTSGGGVGGGLAVGGRISGGLREGSSTGGAGRVQAAAATVTTKAERRGRMTFEHYSP